MVELLQSGVKPPIIVFVNQKKVSKVLSLIGIFLWSVLAMLANSFMARSVLPASLAHKIVTNPQLRHCIYDFVSTPAPVLRWLHGHVMQQFFTGFCTVFNVVLYLSLSKQGADVLCRSLEKMSVSQPASCVLNLRTMCCVQALSVPV